MSDLDHDDYLHRYDEPQRKPAEIQPCSVCGSREMLGRRWDCTCMPKPFCLECWVDHEAWTKAQKVGA